MLYKYDQGKMNFVKTTNWYMRSYVIIGISVLILVYLIMRNQSREMEKIRYIAGETKMLIIKDSEKFSEEKLREFMLQINIRFPHIVFAQAKLESANFTSYQFRINNNMFGMKVPGRRPTMNIGDKYGYSKFKNWKDCVIDYAFYQAAYLGDIHSEDEYLMYLQESYAEDPNYISALKKIISASK